jgi:hypothetical protein
MLLWTSVLICWCSVQCTAGETCSPASTCWLVVAVALCSNLLLFCAVYCWRNMFSCIILLACYLLWPSLLIICWCSVQCTAGETCSPASTCWLVVAVALCSTLLVFCAVYCWRNMFSCINLLACCCCGPLFYFAGVLCSVLLAKHVLLHQPVGLLLAVDLCSNLLVFCAVYCWRNMFSYISLLACCLLLPYVIICWCSVQCTAGETCSPASTCCGSSTSSPSGSTPESW